MAQAAPTAEQTRLREGLVMVIDTDKSEWTVDRAVSDVELVIRTAKGDVGARLLRTGHDLANERYHVIPTVGIGNWMVPRIGPNAKPPNDMYWDGTVTLPGYKGSDEWASD